MRIRAKTPRISWGWLIMASLLLVVTFLLSPLITSYHLQFRAGKLIRLYTDELQESNTNQTKGNFYCLLPMFSDGTTTEKLDRAILWLNKARSLAPGIVRTSFLLGQAYCLKQEYAQAITAFQEFLTLRPENVLAEAEAGFAYIVLAKSDSDPQSAQTTLSKGLDLLRSAGLSGVDALLNYADASFKQEAYRDSLIWYEVSESLADLDSVRLFRFALLQTIFQGSSPYADRIKSEMVLELDGKLTVDPQDLFVLSTGAPIQTRTEANRNVGVLFSNSQDSGILLNVMEASNFCGIVEALDKPPAPTQIGVDFDFQNVAMLRLINGKNDWIQKDFKVFLDQGLHVLSFKLINDAISEGIDRNGYIASLSLKPCK